MYDSTTNLLLPYILAAQAQKHVTHNEALRRLDGIVQLSVIDRDLAAPPASPADGDRYIVASGPAGDWAGWDLNVALWTDGAWLRLLPRTGWRAWVEDEAILLVYDGSGWVNLGGTAGADGASAHDIWLAEGNTGTEADFLTALVGPQGPEGPQGPAGPAGTDGADGTSVTILGSLATTGDLPGTGNSPGDGYIISGDLHVWDGSQWNNVGPIQGPQGDAGPAGADGTDGASAYQIWLDAGNTGTDGDFLAALVGAEGPVGPVGPQGSAGTDGIDGADGASFIWRGTWATSTSYAENDVAQNGGSSYICTTAHTSGSSTEPGVGISWTANWDLAAQKGETGDLSGQGTIGSGPVVLSRRPVNSQAGGYTLAMSDEGASVHMTNGSAATVTVPAESAVAFPLGAEIEIVALGVGVLTIAGATGVTLNGVSAGSADIAAQWQGAVLRKYGADSWLLTGAVGEVT